MYRPSPSLRDRAGTLAVVVLLHAAVFYALLNLTGTGERIAEQVDLAIFDVIVPPPPASEPPPPPPPPEQKPSPQQAKEAPAPASPENIRSRATPVVAPVPRIELPAPSPVVTTTSPSTGAAATQGAGDKVGPGTGAGGVGNGTGAGGAGNGTGGGGLGGARTRLLTPPLSRRDYPDALYRRWPPGGAIYVIVRVGADGSPLSCRVTRSFGDRNLDDETCRLAVERFRFEPGRDDNGRPTADFFGYRQQDNGRFERR